MGRATGPLCMFQAVSLRQWLDVVFDFNCPFLIRSYRDVVLSDYLGFTKWIY